MEGQAEAIEPARAPIDLEPSPALSLVAKAPKTLAGRKVGVLIADGSDRGLIDRVRVAVEKEGGRIEIVAPKIGGATAADRKRIAPDHALPAAPSTLFDAVIVAVASDSVMRLVEHPNAVDWLRDAFAHLKVIGHVPDSAPLFERAGISAGEGVIELSNGKDVNTFIVAAKEGRVWNRERMIAERSEGPPTPTDSRRR
jgi:catalase